MTGTVAGAVHHEQRFLGVGQGHQQGMIAPFAVVRHIDALLALSRGFYNRAIRFDEGLFKKGVRLLLPDGDPLGIDDIHQRVNTFRLEASQKITSGGGIGNPLRSQNIEVGFVVAQ